MRANKSSETLDIFIEDKEEIRKLERGENLRCRINNYPMDEPKVKVVLKCRDEVREEADQLYFSWWEFDRTQPLTERGFWIETFPERGKPTENEMDRYYKGYDYLPEPDQTPYDTVIVTISKERLKQLKDGEVEDNCLLTRCCLDRLQIRYYPQY